MSSLPGTKSSDHPAPLFNTVEAKRSRVEEKTESATKQLNSISLADRFDQLPTDYFDNTTTKLIKNPKTCNLYPPINGKEFKISRSMVDTFQKCEMCFYKLYVLGIGRPKGFPFTLNINEDIKAKNYLNYFREKQEVPPDFKEQGYQFIPYQHPDIATWQNTFKGISCTHEKTGLYLYGGIDDLMIDEKDKNNPNPELIIIDNKATSTKKEHVIYDDYKRQLVFYQWLFRQNGFRVRPEAYIRYANTIPNASPLDTDTHWKFTLLPYKGSDDWIDDTLVRIKGVLDRSITPVIARDCPHCHLHSLNRKQQ